MGKKYGSIHIKTTNGHETATKILDQYDNIPNEYILSAERLEQSHYAVMHDLARTCRRYAAILGHDLFIVITTNWVSVYNRDMSFQAITSKARSFAKKMSEPIVYTSNFDDDVFVFGVIENGKTVTSGRICTDSEYFDLTTRAANMTALRRVLGGDNIIPRRMPTDVSEMEDILSKAMGIPLFAYEDDVYRDSDHFEKTEERNGICVYKKIL